jgi:hypothetical protein
MRRIASRAAGRSMAALAMSAVAPRLALSAPSLMCVAPLPIARYQSRLSAAAKEELDDELQNERATPKIPDGWSVSHKKGESRFIMKKKHNDEALTVVCQLQVLDPEVAERRAAGEGSDVVEHYPFTLQVERNGRVIDFGLTFADGELVIDGMTHYESAAIAKDDTAEGDLRRERQYQGPTFAELSSTFVDAVVDYLETRGVNDDLALFVAEYSYSVEQQEYEEWLRNVVEFTK